MTGHTVERRETIACLKIDVTSCCNELLGDDRTFASEMERRQPIVVLKIDVTTCCNELLRDGRMPLTNGRDVKGRGPEVLGLVSARACFSSGKRSA